MGTLCHDYKMKHTHCCLPLGTLSQGILLTKYKLNGKGHEIKIPVLVFCSPVWAWCRMFYQIQSWGPSSPTHFLLRHSTIKNDIFQKADVQGSNLHGKGSLISTVAFTSHGFKDCLMWVFQNQLCPIAYSVFCITSWHRILEQRLDISREANQNAHRTVVLCVLQNDVSKA